RMWKRILVLLAVLLAAYGLYVGPIYTALHVGPGPGEESYSLPLQQLGRIAKYHAATLTPAERAYYDRMFASMPPEELAKHYVPDLADPMKLSARINWRQHSTAQFLAGWARIAAKYPGTAVEATLASSVGFWDPEAPPYHGLERWSVNGGRGIFLAIPSGEPT